MKKKEMDKKIKKQLRIEKGLRLLCYLDIVKSELGHIERLCDMGENETTSHRTKERCCTIIYQLSKNIRRLLELELYD